MATIMQDPDNYVRWMAGRWITKIRLWQRPHAQPEEGEGSAEHKLVLGDRYLLVSYQGELRGQPFEAMGFIRYDSETNRYVETWMDRTSPAPRIGEGTCDGSGKMCTVTAEFDDPKAGLHIITRHVYRFEDAGHYTLEMFVRIPQSEEFKAMEITHTRSEAERPAESPAAKQQAPVPAHATPAPKSPTKQAAIKDYKPGEAYALGDVVALNAEGNMLSIELVPSTYATTTGTAIEVKLRVTGEAQALGFSWGQENSGITLVVGEKRVAVSKAWSTDEVVATFPEPTLVSRFTTLSPEGNLTLTTTETPVVVRFEVPAELSMAAKQLELKEVMIGGLHYSLIVKLEQ